MIIYTDGSRIGEDTTGFSFTVYVNDTPILDFLSPSTGTSQTAEVEAILYAFKYLHKHHIKKCTILTDSMYVVGILTLGWKINENKELWESVMSYRKGLQVSIKHIKGHAGNEGNERADKLAVIASSVIKTKKHETT